MANAKKVGTLIKKARTDAGLTQEQLAKKVTGASASDIGKAERGEKELTTDQLKQVAKATGVTQKSLLDAAKGTQTVKPAGSSSSSSGSSMKLSAEEKKLIQLYRKADDDAKQKALKALGDEQEESSSGSGLLGSLLGGSGSGSGIVDNLIGLLTGKREMPEGGEGEVTELKQVDPDKK